MAIILVTGSRMWKDKKTIYEVLGSEVDVETDTIIHGGAIGADSIAQEFADEFNIPTKIFRPTNLQNQMYYLHRNAEMVGICDRVIAFKLQNFGGTAFTIRYAKERKKDVKVITNEE